MSILRQFLGGSISFAVGIVLSMLHVGSAQPFVHPGALSTTNDFARMKAKVQAGTQPWLGSYNRLVSSEVSHAQPNLIRGGAGENYQFAYFDSAGAYQLSLRWWVTGNNSFADNAISILNSWANTCTNLGGDPNSALLSLYGYQFACAAENLRTYTNWAATDFAKFQAWMTNLWYPHASYFLTTHYGQCATHHWANWDLCTMNTLLAIGVLCDRRDIYNQAINYYKSGDGAGSASQVMTHSFPGYLGQCQESGRDQGHCTLDPILLGVFCEIAWNQGDDMYAYNTNTLLQVSEYVCKYNIQPLTNNLPYVCYMNCNYYDASKESGGIKPTLSSNARGSVRPGWSLIYHHYVNRLGLSAPWTGLMATQLNPEGGGGDYGSGGGYDQLGFTTLTHTLDPIAPAFVPAPSGLRADVRGSSAILSWWGSVGAVSYNVKRATSLSGPFHFVATGLPPNSQTYTDVGLAQGTTYYYVISAMVGAQETANSAPISVIANRRLNGSILGSSGSYQNAGATKETVFDESLKNYFDSSSGNGQWAGLDLGGSRVITQVRYCPRPGFGGRMVGGQFQAANVADFSSGVVTLYTVASSPPNGVLTVQNVSNPSAFRYVRYLSPNSGYGNVAEVQFYGYSPGVSTPPVVKAVPGNEKVTLSWSVPFDALGFKVKRATVSGGPYTVLATNLAYSTYPDLGLVNHTNYYYVVSTLNENGESADSAEVSASPSAGVNLAAGGSATDWTGTTNTASEGPPKAFDGLNNTKWYNWQAPAPGWLQYNFGTGVQRVVKRYDITSANDVPRRDPAAWLFQGSNNTNSWTTLDSRSGQTFNSRFQTQYYLTGNTTGYQYYRLYVTSNYEMLTNGGSTSDGAQLAELAFWGDGNPPPAAPTGVSALPGDGLVTLNWNSASGATSYNIKRSLVSGGPYVFSTVGTSAGSPFTDASAQNGVANYYVVSAVNANGEEGANSAEVSVTPGAGGIVPAPPSGLEAISGYGQIHLKWHGVAGAGGYQLKRSTSPESGFVVIAGLTALNYADSGVTNGTLYYYTVSATNSIGESVNSASVAAAPYPAISKLTGTIIGTPGSWNNGGDTIAKVFDANLSTFFDAPSSTFGSNCWAGLDLGIGANKMITEIRYCPRTSFSGRMVGGVFQGANNASFIGAVTLSTVASQPPDNFLTSQPINNPNGFRYVRYLSPVGGWGNVAEVEFYGYNRVSSTPTTLSAQEVGDQLQFAWPGDHIGWRLEAQTNSTAEGLGPDWFNVPGAATTNQIFMPIDTAHGSVFFRLVYP